MKLIFSILVLVVSYVSGQMAVAQTASATTVPVTTAQKVETVETTQVIPGQAILPAPTLQTTEKSTTVRNSANEVIIDDKEILLLGEKQARSVRRGSSEFNRINKNYTVTTQVFGQGPVSGRGVGLSFGQFLDRNRLVLFEWMRNDSIDEDLEANEEVRNFSLGAHFKKYERDFYYWRMGTDYRFGSYELSGANGGSFDADSLNVTLAAGVQWYFESFTAGIDAAGVSIPLFTNIRNEETTGSFRSANLKEEKEDLATETQWVLGRVYLGMAF